MLGVQDPPTGIDETMFDAVCEMVAHAISGFGALMTRAFEEAAVAAPKSNLSLRGYLSTLNIPLRWITRKLSEAGDRKTVEKMYREFQKTGKVIKTLSDDDKQIRKLHARQVIRVPIKELDAQPLEPLGTKHVPWEMPEEEIEDDVVLEDEEELQDDTVLEDTEELEVEELEEEEELEEIEELEEDEFEDTVDMDVEAPAKLTRAERRALKRDEKAARKAEKAEAKREQAEAKLAAREAEIEIDDEIEIEAGGELAEYEDDVELDEEIDHEIDDLEEETVLDLESADPDNEIIEYEEAYEDTDDFDAELAELAAIELDDSATAELAAAEAAERDFSAEQSATEHLRGDRLGLESPVVDAPSIGRKTAKRLAKANIRTVIELLDADPEAVADTLKVGYIDAATIINWQDQTMLMMEVPGLRTHDVQVLVGAGIRSGEDLAKASAHEVFRAAIDFLDTDEGERVSRFEDEALAEEEVAEWIDLAKQEAA